MTAMQIGDEPIMATRLDQLAATFASAVDTMGGRWRPRSRLI
ncbi:hypothetical protein [Lentzea albidocapillata]|nr:hypothetical protein [Lentzea albidocapillata]